MFFAAFRFRRCLSLWFTFALISGVGPSAIAQRRSGASQFAADPANFSQTQASRDARSSGLGATRDDTPEIGPRAAGVEARGDFDEQGFVGRDADEVRENFDRTSRRAQQGVMFDMMLENLTEMRRSRRRWQEQQYEAPPVRIRFRPLFAVAVSPPAAVESAVQTTLDAALQAEISGARVTVQGRRATLEGTADTERMRKVAERMALLQPGISDVDNQIDVSEE
ncbi:BON domain-containing protein [Pirellulales bacterium]|nr:BON domain-containing protein [Pirellulales bacterium]